MENSREPNAQKVLHSVRTLFSSVKNHSISNWENVSLLGKCTFQSATPEFQSALLGLQSELQSTAPELRSAVPGL
jgi:hypothetical protein